MANQFLSLSLFLMLLSFFIVLNSMSDFEETKTVPAVLNSIVLAFSGKPQEVNYYIGTSLMPNEDEGGSGEGNTLDNIEGLFGDNIAGFVAKRNKLGTVMHVSLLMSDFESAVKSKSLNPNTDDEDQPMTFAQTMITMLRSAKVKNPYRVDIVYNLENDPLKMFKSVPDTFANSIKRVGSVATILESRGLPKKMVSVGLRQGDAGYVDLYFYRYVPMDTKLIGKQYSKEEGVGAQDREISQDNNKEINGGDNKEGKAEDGAPPFFGGGFEHNYNIGEED